MNSWQLAQQLKHLLASVTWQDGSQNVVFGPRSVIVYAGSTPTEDEMLPAFPFALVTIDSATPDDSAEELLMQQFTIVTAVEVAGDPLGEFSVIGSSRADLGKSAGAGIAEVSERVRFALQDLTGINGAPVRVAGSGTSAPQSLGRGRHLAFEQFMVTAMCSSQPFYAPPQQFRLVGTNFEWVGTHCTNRFDFLRYRVGYVAGSTPAANPSAATIVYTGTAPSYNIGALLPGFTYSVWADYSPRGTGTVAASSDGSVIGSHWPRS